MTNHIENIPDSQIAVYAMPDGSEIAVSGAVGAYVTTREGAVPGWVGQ